MDYFSKITRIWLRWLLLDLAHPPLTTRALGSLGYYSRRPLPSRGGFDIGPSTHLWTPRVFVSAQNSVLISTNYCLFPRIPCPGPGPAQLTVHLDPDPPSWPFTPGSVQPFLCPPFSDSNFPRFPWVHYSTLKKRNWQTGILFSRKCNYCFLSRTHVCVLGHV